MLRKFPKTKQLLIDVARELFGESGKSRVTMNDIAEASNKGRRTLYTYFKSKEDVYKAVIENELNIILEALIANSKKKLSPYDKLKGHIVTHLDSVKKSVSRNGTLRADFFKDIYEVERIRRKIDTVELRILKEILNEGVAVGEFKQIDIEVISTIILYSLKGLEVPFIRQNINMGLANKEDEIIEIIFKGIVKT